MKSFEDRLSRLEDISRLLGQDCPLEEALTLFEEGIALSASLEKELGKIERKVEILISGQAGGEEDSDEKEDSEAEPSGKAQGEGKTKGRGRAKKPALELFPDIPNDPEDFDTL